MRISLTHWRLALVAVVFAITCSPGFAAENIEHLGTVDEHGVRHVSATEAAEALALDPAIKVLDVRTGFEYGRGHLENAINVNYYSFSFRNQIAKLDRNTTWLVHCKTGVRSGKTLPIMRELGFTAVVHMEHGIDSWREADLPEVK